MDSATFDIVSTYVGALIAVIAACVSVGAAVVAKHIADGLIAMNNVRLKREAHLEELRARSRRRSPK